MPNKRDADKTLKNNKLRTPSRTIEGEQGKRSSRVRYACTPELQELLDVLNLIPPDQELKNTPEISRRGSLDNFHPKQSPSWLEEERCQMMDFYKYIDSLPRDFQIVIKAAGADEVDSLMADIRTLPHGVSGEDAPNYWQRRIEIFHARRRWYEDLRRMHIDLYRLVEIGANIEQYLGKELDVVLGIFVIEFARVDHEGRLRRQPNRFAEVLDGVEVSRIRSCLICKKLFWATRKDKRCCSEEHSRIIRQRQSRMSKKEKGKIYAKYAKLRARRQKGEPPAKLVNGSKQKGG